MALDLIAAVLVGVLGAVSAVLFVRGVLGMIANREHQPHWHF